MGFSDLLTSSRGPGLIGTLLALLVLVGFGTLYFFVFDESMQGGGKTIEAVIRDDAVVLESHKRTIESLKQRIEEGKDLKEQHEEIDRLGIRIGHGKKTIAERQAEEEALGQEIVAAEKAWEDYKDAYRASEWASARGEKYAELKTLSGDVYTDVTVTEVDHTGMRVMISSGPKTIASGDLPLDFQDRFQFSAEKKALVIEKREKDFDELTGDVEIASLGQKGKSKLEEVQQLKKNIESANEGIQKCKIAEPLLLRAVDAVRAELAEEQSRVANRNGRRGINRSPQIREKLRVADTRVYTNRRNISDFERRIRDDKRELVRLEREVEEIKDEIAKLRKEKEAKKASEAAAADALQSAGGR